MTTAPTAIQPAADAPGRRRPSRRTVLVAAVITLVLVLLATWIVAFSPVFGVRTVTVRGVHTVTAEQVRAVAHISHGTPLVRLDTAAVARRVETLPGVASATVSTSFPSTVVITVDERTPVGYVRTAHGAVLVDRTGDQYRTVTHAPADLPRFVVPDGSSARTTGGAVAVVAAALPASVRKQVNSIDALNPDSISLQLTHGRTVRWGSAARSADKARILPALLARHPAHIDVSDPDQPFTRGKS